MTLLKFFVIGLAAISFFSCVAIFVCKHVRSRRLRQKAESEANIDEETLSEHMLFSQRCWCCCCCCRQSAYDQTLWDEFLKTRSPSPKWFRDCPPDVAGGFELGAIVRLINMPPALHLNGAIGSIVDIGNDHKGQFFNVLTGGQDLKVRLHNIERVDLEELRTSLRVGETVRLKDLVTLPHFNGMVATIVGKDQLGLYDVLIDGKPSKVSPKNLEPLGTEADGTSQEVGNECSYPLCENDAIASVSPQVIGKCEDGQESFSDIGRQPPSTALPPIIMSKDRASASRFSSLGNGPPGASSEDDGEIERRLKQHPRRLVKSSSSSSDSRRNGTMSNKLKSSQKCKRRVPHRSSSIPERSRPPEAIRDKHPVGHDELTPNKHQIVAKAHDRHLTDHHEHEATTHDRHAITQDHHNYVTTTHDKHTTTHHSKHKTTTNDNPSTTRHKDEESRSAKKPPGMGGAHVRAFAISTPDQCKLAEELNLFRESVACGSVTLKGSIISEEQMAETWNKEATFHAHGCRMEGQSPGDELEWACFGSETLPEHGSVGWDSFPAASCQMGSKGASENQGNFSITCFRSGYTLACVFGGHGPDGHVVSSRAAQTIPFFISKSLAFPHDMPAALVEAFENSQDELLMHALANSWDVQASGSEAVAAVWKDSTVWTANVGDCHCMIASASTGAVLFRTTSQKPHHNLERTRVEVAGGEVRSTAPPGRHVLCRVFVKGADYPGLATARTLGDLCVKDLGVIATPEVHETTIDPGDLPMVVLASNGVWDVLSSKELAKECEGKLSKQGLAHMVEALHKDARTCWNQKGEWCEDLTSILAQLQ